MIEYGIDPSEIFGQNLNPLGYQHNLAAFDNDPVSDWNNIDQWVQWLRWHKVYFSSPLDIDYSMLKAFPDQYRVAPDESSNGPSMRGDPGNAVMGDEGHPDLYSDDVLNLRWYRYLFLGRGKPSTHIRVLGSIPPDQLAQNAPEELRALVQFIHTTLQN
ncbi:hypothetical protein [Marinomonas rhodophyticola]|uniref:Uncharacterized protein n=1 Tax=Marinomonas rhodophyticola TaxID=2992803 RepID=A0ABT3KFW0_9GAMM|nr:hypothetical protein [Marinomonas sp. KJ51-3]MCW4629423.1 hypothetical protein [Marinomonas sp. KJ51-3]